MEPKTILVFIFLLAPIIGAEAAESEAFFTVGGTMVLNPKVSQTITSVIWKHKGNLLAEWVKGVIEMTYYDIFDGRTTLNISSGRLEIRNMTRSDVGLYTLEINSNVHSESYRAKAIKVVPMPSVWVQPVACNHENLNCTMRCDGITTEAEPITYSWREDQGEWKPSEKEIVINKETSSIKTFSCQMKNPVSMKESAPKENPFFHIPPPESHTGLIVGGLIGVICLVVTGLVIYKRDVIMAKLNKNQTNTNAGNGTQKLDEGSNAQYHAVGQKTMDGGSGNVDDAANNA